MAEDNKPTADQIQFALDLAKEKGKDYTKSKLQGMTGKEVSDAIDSMKKEETESSGKQVSFALDLLKEQGKSSPSKAQLDKMPAANISKLIDKLKGSDKKAKGADRKLMERLVLELQDWPHSTLKELHQYVTSKPPGTRKPLGVKLNQVKDALDALVEMGAVVLRGRTYQAKGGRGVWKNKKAGMFNSLDPDQESVAEELYMMASNDGAAYKKRDADGAAKTAMRELRQSRLRDLDYDMKMAHKAVVKALKARWRQSDKEHRQNQRAASMKKQAIVQEAMKRAKADPEFRKKLVAAVQKKAKFPPRAVDVNRLKNTDGFWGWDLREAAKMSGVRGLSSAKTIGDVIFQLNMMAVMWEQQQK